MAVLSFCPIYCRLIPGPRLYCQGQCIESCIEALKIDRTPCCFFTYYLFVAVDFILPSCVSFVSQLFFPLFFLIFVLPALCQPKCPRFGRLPGWGAIVTASLFSRTNISVSAPRVTYISSSPAPPKKSAFVRIACPTIGFIVATRCALIQLRVQCSMHALIAQPCSHITPRVFINLKNIRTPCMPVPITVRTVLRPPGT